MYRQMSRKPAVPAARRNARFTSAQVYERPSFETKRYSDRALSMYRCTMSAARLVNGIVRGSFFVFVVLLG